MLHRASPRRPRCDATGTTPGRAQSTFTKRQKFDSSLVSLGSTEQNFKLGTECQSGFSIGCRNWPFLTTCNKESAWITEAVFEAPKTMWQRCVTSWRNKGCFQLRCLLHRGFWLQLWDWHVYSVFIQLQLLWQFELVPIKVSWQYCHTTGHSHST